MAERKRIWDNYKVICRVRKTDNIHYEFAAAVRDGIRYINIREFYLRKRDGVWRPGMDGLTIPVISRLNNGTAKYHTLANFVKALTITKKEALELPIYDSTHSVWKEGKDNDN